MKILERRVYRGPSQYALFPVMRLTVDLGELAQPARAKIAGLKDGIHAPQPGLAEHTSS